MSEPEDLILEGAHFATRFARDVWRRYGTSVTDRSVPLATVRARARDVPDRPLSDRPYSDGHGTAGASELAVAASARSRARSPGRSASVRHRRTTDLPAAGASADYQRARRNDPLPPPRGGTGGTRDARYAGDVRADRQPRDRGLVSPRRSSGHRSLDRRRSSRPRAGALCRSRRRACLPRRSPHLAARRRARARDLRAPRG